LSALLALLIAFTFNLDQPKWAMLSVFIVAQPRSGLVLAKSCYRIIGTLVGALIALLLVALFAQERVLFLGTLAMWIGLCTFASQYARNFSAYGFVLSGYTAAIVGIPGALDPVNAFYVAEARVTEISLGIIVTAAISHLIFPLSVTSSLCQKIREARGFFAQYVLAVCAGRDEGRLRAMILSQIAAVEKLLASAAFEDSEIRRQTDTLRLLNDASIRVICTSQGLGPRLSALQPTDGSCRDYVENAIGQATTAIEGWNKATIDAKELTERLRLARCTLALEKKRYFSVAGLENGAIPRLLILARLDTLFASIVDYSAAYRLFGQRMTRMRQRSRSRSFHDPEQAAWAGLRAALGVAIASTFWIIADWPSGATAAILSSVVAARLATMERAATVAITGALIFTLAPIPGFILIEVILPAASDFEMFAFILGPAIFLCAWLMGDERSPLKFMVGFLFGLFIPSVGGFQDRISYDAIGFINTSIAVIFAVSVGAILFTVIAPENPQAVRKRFVRTARRNLTRLADLDRSARFCELQTAMGDALGQFAAGLNPNDPNNVATLNAGVALVEVARRLIRLGSGVHRTKLEIAVTAAVAAFFDNPNRQRLSRAHELVLAGVKLGYTDLQDGTFGPRGISSALERTAAYSVIDEKLELGAALVLNKG
jgi:uncharacterized membrane protein YccC